MSYNHFKPFQRNELSALLRAGLTQKKVAELLGKTASAVCQELKRNPANIKTGYDAGIAKENAKYRRIKANARFKKIINKEWIRNYIIRNIKKYWSPEQISGRIKEKWPDRPERQIGKDSIYKFIYEERKNLVKYLRCQKGKYRRRYGSRIREKQSEELKKRRIDKRPEVVEKRERIGDWESDSIIFSKQKTILSIQKEYAIDTYFCDPFASWQKGGVENANKLIRYYLLKNTDLSKLSDRDIFLIQEKLNNRPRKSLNYKSPNDIFNNLVLSNLDFSRHLKTRQNILINFLSDFSHPKPLSTL